MITTSQQASQQEDGERRRGGCEMKKRPFPFPLSTSGPRYLLLYAEYVQGVQGTQFRLPLKRIEDSREGGRDGGMEEVVQRSLCKLIRKKNPDIQYPWMMESASSTESQDG